MNKREIDKHIGDAYEILEKVNIVEQDANGVKTINKTYRGQISTFGAAVTMGSLLPAIAFFSDDGESSVERVKLMKAIYCLLNKDAELSNLKKDSLFSYAQNRIMNHEANMCKEDILNMAITLKLAMNLYKLDESNKKKK